MKAGKGCFQQQKDSSFIRETSIRLTVDFLSETMEARNLWDNILKVHKLQTCQPSPKSGKAIFHNEGEIRTFPSEQNKESIASRLFFNKKY